MPQTYNIKVIQVGHDTYHAFYTDCDVNYANEETALIAEGGWAPRKLIGGWSGGRQVGSTTVVVKFNLDNINESRVELHISTGDGRSIRTIGFDWVIEYRLFGMDEFKTIQV